MLTPARNHPNRDASAVAKATTRTPGIWDSDSEDEDDDIDAATGMPRGASPPKTMSFHIPQSRLLKTPAKEASKRIVDDILDTAGVGRNNAFEEEDVSDEFEIDVDAYEEEMLEDNSPSVVRRAVNIENDTF